MMPDDEVTTGRLSQLRCVGTLSPMFGAFSEQSKVLCIYA